MGLTNTAGGLKDAVSPPMGVLGGRILNIKCQMENFREVSNRDKSTSLEYFSNDNSIKKRL